MPEQVKKSKPQMVFSTILSFCARRQPTSNPTQAEVLDNKTHALFSVIIRMRRWLLNFLLILSTSSQNITRWSPALHNRTRRCDNITDGGRKGAGDCLLTFS